jgi:N-ethylmaleimide reductase
MAIGDELFQPLRLGAIEAPNRIFMSPLTRARATDRVPNELMARYYTQRASAGLIVTEATAISARGYGWLGSPGIYPDEAREAWLQSESEK